MFGSKLDHESPFHELLFLTNIGRSVSKEVVYDAFLNALKEPDPEQRTHTMSMILNGLMAKGPSEDEVSGLLDAAFSIDGFNPRERDKFQSSRKTITVAGSGKKGFKTVNISSLACLVAACHGNVTILKLCSPSTSSATGSQDFFTKIGGNVNLAPEILDEITETLGIGFYPVEQVLPDFASVYSGRYYAPHALSFALAGMTCRYTTDYLLYGLAHPNLSLSLDLFRRYDYTHAMVVSSTFDGVHYIDEMLGQAGISVQGYRKLTDINPRRASIDLNDELNINYTQNVRSAIAQTTDKEENVIKGLAGLYGSSTLTTQIAINAALILLSAETESSFKELFNACLGIIERGEPIEKLRSLVRASGGNEVLLNQYLLKAEASQRN